MKKNFPVLTVFCLTLLPCTLVLAQEANTATTPKPVNLFYRSVNEGSHLYNGTEYIMYDQHIKGFPYFGVADLKGGSVLYDGTLYENVDMLYDISTDQVVIRRYNEGVLMNLINEKLVYFKLLDHVFVNIVPDSNNTIVTKGFYDRLYNGKTIVYARRKKIVYEDQNTFEKSFIATDKYFIYKDGTWHAVSGQGDVLNVFKEKKKDISKYLRQNKIKFKKDPEYAMVKMAEYYDQLTH